MSKCMDPVLCYTGQNTRKFRHFSLSSPNFKALHQTVFNCGKCIFCRKRKATELAMRCVLHASMYKQNCFLTLTYDEKKEGYHNVFEYSDIQKFKKNLRQFVRRKKQAEKIDIFNVHEYGRKGKKHWHLVVFGWKPQDREPYSENAGYPLTTSRGLSTVWKHGFHTIGDVSEASAMYQAQYTQKDFKYSHAGTSKKSHSKHSGIGKPFFFKHFEQLLSLGYVPFNGRKAPLPRYFLKLAHRQWCHYNERSAFFPIKGQRKEGLYSALKPGEENLLMAQLFEEYQSKRKEFIKQISDEWDDYIDQNLFSKDATDFQKSGSNTMYDLLNKNNGVL